MATTTNSRGLLGSPEDELIAGSVGGPSTAPGNGPGIYSPFAGQQAQLAGGSLGTQQLNYGGQIQQAGKQYAFNPKYAAMDQALQRAIANAGLDRTNRLSQLDQGYQAQIGDAERLQGQAQKALAARMASQGIFNSGINVEATGDLTNDYQRYTGNLGQQLAGGKAGVENEYGRLLGDVAAQREGMWGMQAEDERVAAQEAARQQAEAQARAQQAAMQQQLQQQMIQQQQAALQQQMNWQQQQLPRANGIGGGGGGGDPAMAAMGSQDMSAVLGMINASGDLNQLRQFGTIPGLPIEVTQALMRRIQDVGAQVAQGANRNSGVPGAVAGNTRAY